MTGTLFRWIAPVAVIIVFLLLAGTVSGQPVAGASEAMAAHSSHVRRFMLPNSAGLGDVLAAHGSTTLLSYGLTNGSSVIDEYSAATAGPVELQLVPGGPSEFPSGVAWAASRFLVSIQNVTTGTTFYESFTVQGRMTIANIPEATEGLWTVIDSTGGSVYLSSPGSLLALNESTLSLDQSFDSVLPAGAGINSVALLGGQLYLGGAISPATGGAYAFYGAIDLASGTLTTLSPTETYPTTYLTTVLSVVVARGMVFFGGQSLSFGTNPSFFYQTDGPVLVSFQPCSGSLRNLSGELSPQRGVGQLVVLGGAVGVVAPFWGFTVGGQLTGAPGFYLLNARTGHLRNETAVVGTDLLVIASETAASGGQLITMGEQLSSGVTELVVVPFSAFDLH